MNIKQFLKPDWRKILIFVMILFLEYSLWTEMTQYPPEPGEISFCCRDLKQTEIMPDYCKEINLTTEDCLKYENTRKIDTFRNLLIMIFDVILVYIISCLIIWIYDKVKKKP